MLSAMPDFLNHGVPSIMVTSPLGRRAPGGTVILMSPSDVGDSGMENLLSRPDDRPPDAEEILRRLRDQLLEAHRRKIFRRAGDGPAGEQH